MLTYHCQQLAQLRPSQVEHGDQMNSVRYQTAQKFQVLDHQRWELESFASYHQAERS